MLEYFTLQYKMTNRKIIAFGLHPAIAYLLLFSVFIGFSIYLFSKIVFAPYIYAFISLALTTKLSDVKRNDFLKICFRRKNYRLIRILENLIIAFPFLIFLASKLQFYPAIGLLAGSILLALLNFKISYSFTIPTPFGKYPFEFTIGFRNTFYLFPIFYYIAIMAITAVNFNLGVVVLLATFLVIACYYLTTEHEYFVWVYNLTSKQFLVKKIKTAIAFSSLLVAPIVIALGIFYFHYLPFLLLFVFVGYLLIIFLLFAKYSAFPQEISLPQLTLMIFCLMMPVILVVITPYLGNQAFNRLKNYLE